MTRDLVLCQFGLLLLGLFTLILLLILAFSPNIKFDITGIATIILAIGTLFLAYDSHQQFHEMQAEQRPWVKWTKIKPQGILERKGNSLIAHISYQLQAVGRNAAINVSFWAKLLIVPFEVTRKDFGNPSTYIPSPPVNVIRQAKDNCDAGGQATRSQVSEPSEIAWGQTVFPGEITEPYNFEAAGGDFTIELIRNDDDIIIRLLACVTYADSVTREVHETAINYLVTRTTPEGLPGNFVINLSNLPLAPQQWTIMVDTLNAGFAK